MRLNGSIIIELTRWCNLECGHCLRGERQRMRLKKEYLNQFLSNFNYIDTVTFTGGEPTLAVDLIEHFMDYCRIHDLNFSNYYIATNAEKITKRFLNVWGRLHNWADSNEISAIDISNDKFHMGNPQAYKLLDYAEMNGMENCHFKYNKFKPDYENCISEGRAENWSSRKSNAPEFMIRTEKDQDIIGYIEGELYLNCKGNIINGCDWSFESQDKPEHIISHVSTFEPEMLYKWGKEEEENV